MERQSFLGSAAFNIGSLVIAAFLLICLRGGVITFTPGGGVNVEIGRGFYLAGRVVLAIAEVIEAVGSEGETTR